MALYEAPNWSVPADPSAHDKWNMTEPLASVLLPVTIFPDFSS